MLSPETEKILFLDFDGVLHSVGPASTAFEKVPLLENLLRTDCASVQVVISSSWREYECLAQLRSHFSQDLHCRIVGSTPLDADPRLHSTWGLLADLFPREIQIRQYLAMRGLTGCKWVALDDTPGWFREGVRNPNLVYCESDIGLTPLELAQVAKHFA